MRQHGMIRDQKPFAASLSSGQVDGRRRGGTMSAIFRACVAMAAGLCVFGPAMAVARQPVDLQPVSAAQARQDLAGLAETIERNVPSMKDATARASFVALARRLSASLHGSLPAWRVWLLEQKLVRAPDHGHLMLFPNAIEDRVLAVNFRWVSDGLLVSPAAWSHAPSFPANSQVVTLGGRTPAQMLVDLEGLIGGVTGWVKQFGGRQLRNAYELRWLGLLDDKGQVHMTVRTQQGRIRKVVLSIMPRPDREARQRMAGAKRSPAWFRWSIDRQHGVGWFTLDKMQLTAAYERSVAAFFHAVKQAGVARVVIDLRHNDGGNLLAEAPFMCHLGVKDVRNYADTLHFDTAHLRQAMASMPSPRPPVPAAPADDALFHGRIYVLTGPETFSSAMDFALDVQLNGIGKLVGSPPGEHINSPGEIRFFGHPASGVPFQVPTRMFRWPGTPKEAMVKPDVIIPLTVSDVQQGRDPIRGWLDRLPHDQ